MVISALGLWKSWQSDDKPATVVVEERRPIALTLRGTPRDDGRTLEIPRSSPAMRCNRSRLRCQGGARSNVGSDGELAASDVESALGEAAETRQGYAPRARSRSEARLCRSRSDAVGRAAIMSLTYRWEGGGLFGGKSLRLVSLSPRLADDFFGLEEEVDFDLAFSSLSEPWTELASIDSA